MKNCRTIRSHDARSGGFALLVALIVLVVLTMLMAGLATRLTMAKRRQLYMIEYQRAQYGLDSGLKYILSEIPDMSFDLESREGKPDFSDLFWMDQSDYTQMIADWAEEATEEEIEAAMKDGASLYETEPVDMASLIAKVNALFGSDDDEETDAEDVDSDETETTVDADSEETADTSEAETADEDRDDDSYYIELDPNDIEVPGPYGVDWPLVTEPIEMEVGDCSVTITIEDENAKLPLSWLVAPYKEDDTTAEYALETFLEWMAEDTQELAELEQSLKEQLLEIYDEKHFQIKSGDILVSSSSSSGTKFKTVRKRDSKTGKIVTKRVPVSSSTSRKSSTKRSAVANRADFAKLFHSSLLNRDQLNTPRTDRGIAGRVEETILDYVGLWGSQRVNINTAPRHILEAAFVMATSYSDAVTIADEVITHRQEEAFEETDEIKELGLLDADTYNDLKNYITTTSTFFKITVTSSSGNASNSAVAAVIKEDDEAETLVVLYGQR